MYEKIAIFTLDMGQVKIVSASAGAGKTYNLAREYIRNVIADTGSYRHILAVTFTNKATAEMKERILQELNVIANDEPGSLAETIADDLKMSVGDVVERAKLVRSRILHDYSHFAVLTIDKFFQRIIRSFLRELGIDINFNIELQNETLLDEATSQMLADVATNDALREWIVDFVGERIDDSAGWNIRSAVTSDGKEVLSEEYRSRQHITSKEELLGIVRQVVAQAEKAKKSLASAAQSVIAVLDDNALVVSDINGGQRGVMGWVTATASGETKEPTKSVLATLAGEKEWFTKTSSHRSSGIAAQLGSALQDAVNQYNASIRTINTAKILRSGYRRFALMSDLRERITRVSQRENLLHISETNEILAKLIADSDAPFIFEKVGNYFTHYMLDEFQDTSSLQWANFLPLLRNAVSQSEDSSVMLVGDTKQAIYRWRGGDYRILASDAAEMFDQTRHETLSQNWRSKPKIVEFNNTIIERSVAIGNRALNEKLDAALATGDISAELHAYLYDELEKAYGDYRQVPARDSGGYVTMRRTPKNEEGKYVPRVVEMVEELQDRGYRARDIAILVRTNNEGEQIAGMLLAKKSENADSKYNYDVVTQDALLVGHSGVCVFVMAVLQLSLNQSDSIQRAIYNHYLGREFCAPLSEMESRFLERLTLASLEEAFCEVVMRYELNAVADNIVYLQAIEEQIIRYVARNVADTASFVRWWDEHGRRESLAMPQDADAITIDTIHKSKGLGYEAVIIPYCNWEMTSQSRTTIWTRADGGMASQIDAFPVKFEKASAQSAFSEGYYREMVLSYIDGMNIFYVAATRAKSELHVMMPDKGGGIADVVFDAMPEFGEFYELGTPNKFVPSTDNNTTTEYLDFEVNPVSERVATSLVSSRYFEEDVGSGALTPRNYGILMHALFARAESREQLYGALERLKGEEGIDEAESKKLKEHLEEALANPIIEEWFSPVWDKILNEASIITASSENYRPDRVMLRGGNAVVVDYKFGERTNMKYADQMRGYISLLNEMGYDSKGYLWYVNINKIEKIDH